MDEYNFYLLAALDVAIFVNFAPTHLSPSISSYNVLVAFISSFIHMQIVLKQSEQQQQTNKLIH